MKILVAILFAGFLAGCTSVSYNGANTLVDRVSYPKVGEVVTAQVGDHLVEKGSVIKEEVLKVNRNIDGLLYTIPAGSYRQLGSDDKNDFYESAGVSKSFLADPFKALAVSKQKKSEVCVVTTLGTTSCYEGDYDKTYQIVVSEDSFKQTLIYNGRVGSRINIGYREYSNNFARPAYNNEVEYDLSDSNVIGYKGSSIEVVEAGNSSITYRLIKNFPD